MFGYIYADNLSSQREIVELEMFETALQLQFYNDNYVMSALFINM